MSGDPVLEALEKMKAALEKMSDDDDEDEAGEKEKPQQKEGGPADGVKEKT